MARLIVVELLDPRGTLRARTRLDALPATIGRGYDSDVIVDDPYVCARHARIVEDEEGRPVIEDEGSVNGMYMVDGTGPIGRLTLRPDVPVRIGRTMLRVRPADYSVPPAIDERRGPHGLLGRLDLPYVSVGACAAVLTLFALQSYSQSYERGSAARALGAVTAMLLVLAIWAGIWSVVSRAVSHRFHFLRHLAVAALAALGGLVVVQGAQWLEFLAPQSAAAAFLGFGGFGALGAGVLAAHLGVASSLSRGARLRWAAGVTLAGAALLIVVGLADDDEFSNKLDDPGSLKPYGAHWVRTEPASDFALDARTLRARVDSLAEARH